MKWLTGAFLLMLAALAAWVALGGGSDSGHMVSVEGSTSIAPFAEMLAQSFHSRQKQVRVEIQAVGSTAGIQKVLNGVAKVGMCSRSLHKAELDQGLTPIVIARDGLAVVVHKGNPVSALTREQIRAIYAGYITNWRQVGGEDGPIHLITREEGSGTREAFTKLVMEAPPAPSAASRAAAGKAEPIRISRRALTQESNGAVKELVSNDRHAIGYMSLGLVKGEAKMLKVDGVAPTAEEVLAGRYALVRPFLYVVRGRVSQDSQAFIDFTLSPEGQKILTTEGLVSVK
jgi:phosphate transport system substrate-binding protein